VLGLTKHDRAVASLLLLLAAAHNVAMAGAALRKEVLLLLLGLLLLATWVVWLVTESVEVATLEWGETTGIQNMQPTQGALVQVCC
jgi:hypothetical protein